MCKYGLSIESNCRVSKKSTPDIVGDEVLLAQIIYLIGRGFYHILKILIVHCFAPFTCANVSYSVANTVLLVKTISGLFIREKNVSLRIAKYLIIDIGIIVQ